MYLCPQRPGTGAPRPNYAVLPLTDVHDPPIITSLDGNLATPCASVIPILTPVRSTYISMQPLRHDSFGGRDRWGAQKAIDCAATLLRIAVRTRSTALAPRAFTNQMCTVVRHPRCIAHALSIAVWSAEKTRQDGPTTCCRGQQRPRQAAKKMGREFLCCVRFGGLRHRLILADK